MKKNIVIKVATEADIVHSKTISDWYVISSKERGTGIATRTPEYLEKKMRNGNAIIAFVDDELAGFCYVEVFSSGEYVSNSGLIVTHKFRSLGLAKKIKAAAFNHARDTNPDAKVFGITTSDIVMNINSDLGYRPVSFSQLTTDEEFWKGCSSCPNYDILTRNNKKMCLCTAMVAPSKNQSMKKDLILAYSGGLDTSYCILYLKEQGYNVHAVNVNTGGFSKDEIFALKKRALEMGAASFKSINNEEDYYAKCVRYLIYGNILRNNTYPLSVSSERAFQAIAVLEYAQEKGFKYVAHGSTGAGNDQIRFDTVFESLGGDIEVITPIRDQKLSRQEEIDFINAKGFDWKEEKKNYSINQGLWGTSIGGKETLKSRYTLPEEAYMHHCEKEEPMEINITFSKGQPIALNGERCENIVELIKEVNNLGNQYAIGRDVHVGDTIIGIKGRVGFEAPAALMIIKAHHLLEKHTLSKWQTYWKQQLSDWYGMFLHEGKYFEPVMRNIEGFLTDSQHTVNGTVYLKLAPYRFELIGIESENDLMNSIFGQYGEVNNAWTGQDAKGFTKIFSNADKIFYAINDDQSPV
jgi:argininosuccinate synthase